MTAATAAPARVQHTTLWAVLGAVVTGAVLAATAAAADRPLLILAGAGLLAMSLIVAAAIYDGRTGLLPNRLLAPAAAVLAAALPLHALLTGDLTRLGQGLLGAGIAAAVYIAVYATGATSAGDVKLATIISFHTAYLGWTVCAIAIATPYLLAIPVVLFFVGRRLSQRRIPFGPFLAVGYLLAVGAAIIGA